MGRSVFLAVLSLTIVAILIGVFLLPGRESRPVNLPWQTTVTPRGGLQVFGVEIGYSTLAETEQTFREPAEVSLFSHAEKKMIEAYFDSVDINGLRARVVVVMAVEEPLLSEIYDRGVRVANMGGGRQKVTLAERDLARVKQLPIGVVTYIPRINLDEKLITSRFGEPAERLPEREGKIVHWLYPDRGLDIALDPEGKEVLQYLPPREFERVRGPLLAGGG